MMAASKWPLSEARARKVNSRSCVNSTGNATKGPTCRPATASASTEISMTSVDAPRGPNRNPAQPMMGKKMKAIGTSRSAKMPQSPKISWAPKNMMSMRATPSAIRGQVQGALRPLTHDKMKEATIMVPSQSRSTHNHKL
jgi:hypothetical protein